ncbi:Hint domain-containing protein [Roseicyclus persicicus]|uniref:Hedgehog/Intein (Hint) domain-containing protein n=1 Tax=Roseicyclus persicicus TaxID=2650661 RepID=A0A7X6JXK2_9RHOB|nr:Hint domain-containing protein [Roseibacterium persicicum]NKX43165.1 hypothetical protein [Roseibacterium persicicum]
MSFTGYSAKQYADDGSGGGLVPGDGVYSQSLDPFVPNGSPLLGPHSGDGLDTQFSLNEDVTGAGNLYLGTITHNGDPFLVLSAEFPFVPGPTTAGDIVLLAPPWVTADSASAYPDTVDLADLDTAPFTFCFAAGTLIATTAGEVAVEDLTRDHMVLTADGRAVPVAFLGWQDMPTRFPFAKGSLVRIAAGALGDGLPKRDLTVTGDHAMMIDGTLVNAAAMVNGSSIRYLGADEVEPMVRVYHVETARHEVLLAEGAPSESFIDYAGRKQFGNYADYLAQHGADRLIAEMPAPRVTAARHLPAAIRARLDAAAGLDAGAELATAV